MRMISATINDIETMVLIDNILRLGISYHFEAEIGERLRRIYNDGFVGEGDDDLYVVSLRFRLLRQTLIWCVIRFQATFEQSCHGHLESIRCFTPWHTRRRVRG
ncbi:hypothetical protein AMTRI_Chr03g145990 [Amborella trichopoda]